MNIDPKSTIDMFVKTVSERYTAFQGRARRTEFWNYVLVYVIAIIVLAIVQVLFALGSLLTGLFSLVLLVPSIAISVRRLHDINKSGWLLLISLAAPIAAGIFGPGAVSALVALAVMALFIYWYLQPGTSGDNQYGSDPKAVA